MVVRAALRIRHHGCVSEGLVDGTVMTQVSGERGWDVFILHAPEGKLDAAFELVCSNGTPPPGILDRTDRCVVFRGHNLPRGIVATIRESPCWIEWPIVYRDGIELYTLSAPTRAELRALLDRLREHGDIEVLSLAETPAELADEGGLVRELAGQLTAKQLDALHAAAARGYYDEGRRITTDELAADAGLSPSTYREHLLKAERAIVKGFLRLATRYPETTRATARKPGRPPRN